MRQITAFCRWQSIALFLIFFLPSQAFAIVRIGFVDLRKALNAVEDGRYAKERLQRKKSTYQKTLDKEQKTLKREKDVFDSRATILRGQAKRKAEVELQKKFFRLQQLYTRLTRELAKEEAQETRKIFVKMEAIIRKIAQENNLILMLEKTESSVLFALPSMDFTSELIRRYDRIYAKSAESTPKKRRRKKK